MNTQVRTIKTLVFLVAAMTIGAFILMALDKENISAGPFSLSSYTQLNSINQAALSPIKNNEAKWNRIEVFYSNTSGGTMEDIARHEGVNNYQDLNFHLAVFNGNGAQDGQITPTAKWKDQLASIPNRTWVGSAGTIRICVVADGVAQNPTGSQIKRTAVLVESLSRRCGIPASQIKYPANWQF